MGHITEAEEKKKKARKNRIRDRLILEKKQRKRTILREELGYLYVYYLLFWLVYSKGQQLHQKHFI